VGQFPVCDGHRVLEIREDSGKAVLIVTAADGRRSDLKVDHVVAATGYRVDLDRITYLSTDVRARMRTVAGFPHLSPSFESSVPGLYVAGMAAAATFGPLMRFVCGTSFAAPRISAAVNRSQAAP
jgi:thioredoxin reductase